MSCKCSIIFILLVTTLIISGCGSRDSEQLPPVSVTAAGDTSAKAELSADAAMAMTTADQAESTEAENIKKSSDGVVEYIRDHSGNIISEVTHSQDGTPILNDRGFYKGLYTYDSYGNLLTEAYYDTKEVLVNTSDGYAHAIYAYHKDGSGQYHILREDRFSSDGSRADIPDDYSYRRDEWDGNRIISTSFYGADDQLTCPSDGYAQLLYEYQEGYSTRTITKKYFDEKGSPLAGPEGGALVVSEYTSNIYPVNTFSAMFDDITSDDLPADEAEEGSDTEPGFNVEFDNILNSESYIAHRLLRRSIYGTDHEQVNGVGGWHIIQNALGENGEILRTDYLDHERKTTICSDGYASVVYKYDESGRVTRAEYYDQEEHLLNNRNTIPAIITFDYSESRNVPQLSDPEPNSGYLSFGADYYVIRREQDKNGKTMRKTYLNSRQKPVLCAQGYAFEINSRNDRGKLIKSEYLDKEERPVKTAAGYASVSYTYDDKGNKESESYFDPDGNPTWCNDGYHMITFTYDDHRHCTEEHLYNIYQDPAIHYGGRYSSLIRTYNHKGKVSSIKYYGISGDPGLYQGCYFEEGHRYDENGHETEVFYTDLNGDLCSCRDGYAKKLITYNDQDNITEESFFDKEGNPVNSISGYASVSYNYDESGNLLSVHYYDADHKSTNLSNSTFAYYVIERDEEGRLTSLEYYNDSGNPVNGRDGYASCHVSYTPSGHVSEEYYRDQNGKPAVSKEGYSHRTLVSEDEIEGTYEMRVTDESESSTRNYEYALIKYDDQNRAIEHRYYSKGDKPVNGPEGCFMTISSYSTNNDMVHVFFFDRSEKQTAVNGVYGVQREYTTNGRLEAETWLGKSGKPAINQDGYAILQYYYEFNSQEPVEKEYRYYQDTNGKPVEASNGSYGIRIFHYLNTNVCETTYLGVNGEPVNAKDGFALYRSEVDENGNVIRESYFDANGARTEGPGGYSTIERGYDTENRVISERYMDHYNKLTNNADGIAGWNGSYDSSGNLIIDSQYDKDLNPIK